MALEDAAEPLSRLESSGILQGKYCGDILHYIKAYNNIII